MATLTNEQIKKIADELDTGCKCYIHKKTRDFKAILDVDDMYDFEELIEEDMKEIEANRPDYFLVEKMSSSEAFRIMESFLPKIASRKKKERVINALNRRSPFANFKQEVEYDEKYRQLWFDHKNRKHVEYVRDQLGNTFELEELAPEIIEIDKTISFEGKTFILLHNSEAGETNEETTFEYEQEGDLVTADYTGGTIRYGKIIGKLKNDQLDLVYQCLTTEGELKSGTAVGKVEFTNEGKMVLKLDWEWLSKSGTTGKSAYIEK